MTHGEAWLIATCEENLDLKKDYQRAPKGLPKPMSRKDAVLYYNTKLFRYWVREMSADIPKTFRVKTLKTMMFGHVENAKLLKEDASEGV